MLLDYDHDNYSQVYGEIKEAFRALTKDVILQPYLSDKDFTSSNDDNDVGYNIYVFDIRYQHIFTASQTFKVEGKFNGVDLAGIYGYALVSTNKLASIGSDGQRHFDLI